VWFGFMMYGMACIDCAGSFSSSCVFSFFEISKFYKFTFIVLCCAVLSLCFVSFQVVVVVVVVDVVAVVAVVGILGDD